MTTAEVHWHDETCHHCPRCGAPLEAPYNLHPPHWELDKDGYDVPENRPAPDAAPPVTAEAPPASRARFVIELPEGDRLTLEPGRSVLLGRDHQPAFRNLRRVAGTQAEIALDAHCRFSVRDVGTEGRGSTNGTWVANERLGHRVAMVVPPGTAVRFADAVWITLRREDV